MKEERSVWLLDCLTVILDGRIWKDGRWIVNELLSACESLFLIVDEEDRSSALTFLTVTLAFRLTPWNAPTTKLVRSALLPILRTWKLDGRATDDEYLGVKLDESADVSAFLIVNDVES